MKYSREEINFFKIFNSKKVKECFEHIKKTKLKLTNKKDYLEFLKFYFYLQDYDIKNSILLYAQNTEMIYPMSPVDIKKINLEINFGAKPYYTLLETTTNDDSIFYFINRVYDLKQTNINTNNLEDFKFSKILLINFKDLLKITNELKIFKNQIKENKITYNNFLEDLSEKLAEKNIENFNNKSCLQNNIFIFLLLSFGFGVTVDNLKIENIPGENEFEECVSFANKIVTSFVIDVKDQMTFLGLKEIKNPFFKLNGSQIFLNDIADTIKNIIAKEYNIETEVSIETITEEEIVIATNISVVKIKFIGELKRDILGDKFLIVETENTFISILENSITKIENIEFVKEFNFLKFPDEYKLLKINSDIVYCDDDTKNKIELLINKVKELYDLCSKDFQIRIMYFDIIKSLIKTSNLAKIEELYDELKKR